MAEIIIMPKQGLQMTEGLITQWLKQEGEAVQEGEPLFEMETDKLTITIDSTANGTLLKILHPEGDTVPITQPIAVVGAPGEDISALHAAAQPIQAKAAAKIAESASVPEAPQKQPGAAAYSTPRANLRAAELGIDIHTVSGTGPEGLIIERDVLQLKERPGTPASPLARKLAQAQNIPLADIAGSGPHGKIMADDVRLFGKAEPAPAEEEDLVLPISGMRRIIAQRMKGSLLQMAQTTHTMQVDMSEAVRLRKQFLDAGMRISYNDIILRCVAQALRDCPYMNAVMTEDAIIQKRSVHLGMAVATDAGLLVPVIKHADRLSLQDISRASADLAARVKENRVQPDELQGGTFTVSNLGMYDVDHFTAIINAPEAGILAVGKLQKQPVVLPDDTIGIRSMMQLTLTYDHRVVDGAPAAAFLKRIKTLLECPALML